MATYVDINTQEVKTKEEWIKVFSNISLPKYWTGDILTKLNLSPLIYSNPPEDTVSIHYVQDGVTRDLAGLWVTAWKAVPKFEEYTEEDGTVVTVEEQVASAEAERIAYSMANIQEELTQDVKERLDTFAQTRMYDDILSACTYTTSPVAYMKAEADYCLEVRSLTWEALRQTLEDVHNGVIAVPNSFEDIEHLLPVLEWPEFVEETV